MMCVQAVWYLAVIMTQLCCPVGHLNQQQSFFSIFGQINIMYKHSSIFLWEWRHKKTGHFISTRGGWHVKTECAWNDKKEVQWKKTALFYGWTYSYLRPSTLSTHVFTPVSICACVSVSCWPSWVCRSCEHLLLSVLGPCDPLHQSCGPALVQKLADPVEHWTNSGALPQRFRPPQTLPTADGLWQPNDGHSAEFLTQSSSGKLATQHWAGQHTGSEPKKIREYREENRDSI